jgi:hypothetical protein
MDGSDNNRNLTAPQQQLPSIMSYLSLFKIKRTIHEQNIKTTQLAHQA